MKTRPRTSEKLYAVHAKGPDDIIACESEDAAEKLKAVFDKMDQDGERAGQRVSVRPHGPLLPIAQELFEDRRRLIARYRAAA